MDAAIIQAAHDTLVALFSSQAAKFNSLLASDLSAIPAGKGNAKAKGIALGHTTANSILGLRSNDGSQSPIRSRHRFHTKLGARHVAARSH
jgi:hypothetical protein